MERMIILQTVTPAYRKNFFTYLKRSLNNNFVLFGGDFYFDKSVKSDATILFKKQVKNYFFLNRKILFQMGMWHMVLKQNRLVLEMNPRIISNWIILLLRKWSGNKTILWGHAWPREGSTSKSDNLRNIMRKLADEIIVYTKTQQIELQRKMPSKKIYAAPNSIYYRKQMTTNQDFNLIKNIIYVGRLTKGKKPMLLVKAFHLSMKNLPEESNLILVGDGGERELIENYIKQNNLIERIKLLGPIDDYEKLKELYNTSLLSVSPGYVGLSATQSFGFGVPLIISKNEPHSPEIEAVKINKNAKFFSTDRMESLSQEIIKIYNQKELWVNKRIDICNFCKENYSVEAMAESFLI
jgi:glycosyltransferase involved in cell wall biosynthesis